MKNTLLTCSLFITLGLLTANLYGQEHRELAIGQAKAIVDLRKVEAVQGLSVSGWQTLDATITQNKFRAPGPSITDPNPLYPTGKTISTHNLAPKPGTPEFESAAWINCAADELEIRRGNGLMSFVWYRLALHIPEQIGIFPTKGSTAVLEIVADDYSEITVNGQLAKTLGQSGSGAISGWNARNRVLLTTDAQPGQTFDIAILAANAPFSNLPENYIWLRSATLDFYDKYPTAEPVFVGHIEKKEPALDSILPPGVLVEKLADGFQFIEGPVWHPEGYLLFSDPNTNVIYRFDPSTHNVSVYHTKSGYTGVDIGLYHQPGSNGLAIDAQGRLLVCQHGNRQVVRHEVKGPLTVLSDQHNGQRLNSPNDLVVKSDGTIYFTDPPYGLPTNYNDPRKETPHQGIYRIVNEKTELLSTELGGPNGLAFSPDERYLYVGNWDIRDIQHTKTLWRFELTSDGRLANGKVFFDFYFTDGDEALDGIKVDRAGNVFVSAPGGIWVLSSEGEYLGKIIAPERPANMAWGDADGKTLYLTAHTGLYRIRTLTGKATNNP